MGFCIYGRGIRPETAVNAMQITLTTRKNFQATFHHWPSGILQTPRPATSIALVGEMRDMAALPMERPVTAASGFKPISSTSGPKMGIVRAAMPEELGTRIDRRLSTT